MEIIPTANRERNKMKIKIECKLILVTNTTLITSATLTRIVNQVCPRAYVAQVFERYDGADNEECQVLAIAGLHINDHEFLLKNLKGLNEHAKKQTESKFISTKRFNTLKNVYEALNL